MAQARKVKFEALKVVVKYEPKAFSNLEPSRRFRKYGIAVMPTTRPIVRIVTSHEREIRTIPCQQR